jgi:hypothetical protein
MEKIKNPARVLNPVGAVLKSRDEVLDLIECLL